MPRQPMFNEDQVQKMVDSYTKAGLSLARIGADFGVSVPTIAKYLRAAGVEIRSRGRRQGSRNVPRVDAVVEMPAKEEVVEETVEEETTVENTVDALFNTNPETPLAPAPWRFDK